MTIQAFLKFFKNPFDKIRQNTHPYLFGIPTRLFVRVIIPPKKRIFFSSAKPPSAEISPLIRKQNQPYIYIVQTARQMQS
jgi:hypothetical protein